jgi:hypothetical protein
MRRPIAWITAAALSAVVLGVSGTVEAGPFTLKGTQPPLTNALFPPIACAGCHDDFDPTSNHEPWPLWAGSMMGQASRDPLFWAALDVANNDAPGVGDWCLRCHVPEGWFAGRSEPPDGSEDGCGLFGPLDSIFSDFNGVSCHVCHRAEVNPSPPPGQQPFYLENGQLWLDDSDCDGFGEPCRAGPYDYTGGGASPPPHAWRYSPYHISTDLCGGCHNVTSPTHNLIDQGIDTGVRFPIERTEIEWSQSDYAVAGSGFQNCQSCHMPDALEDPVFACIDQATNRSGDLPQHIFVGGNAWIPEVLRLEYPNLGLDTELAATRDAALDMLQMRTATLDVSSVELARGGAPLHVDVTVTNLSGHKLPTGYPEGRRMWIQVEARDANDELVWESGGWDPETGDLAVDPQLKVYEAKQGIWNLNGNGTCDVKDSNGREIFHFVKNNCIALDNRIPPRGFMGGADIETRPVGYVYPETFPGSGVLSHWDITSYSVPIPADVASPVTIRAALRYQTASKEYVDFLKDEADTHGFPDDCIERTTGLPGKSRGALLHEFWSRNGLSPPVDVAMNEVTVPVTAGESEGCYSAKPSSGSPAATLPSDLSVTDPFYATGQVSFKAARSLCTPAEIDHEVLDPSLRLAGYPVKLTAASPPRGPYRRVGVRDRFGDHTIDLTKLHSMLLPASLDPTIVPPAPPSSALDTYTCYKGKISSGTTKLPKGLQVTASDEFTSPATVLDVAKLRHVCVPTDVGAGVVRPDVLLMCYKSKPAPGQPRHQAQFGLNVTTEVTGAQRLDTRKGDAVCVPAVRTGP